MILSPEFLNPLFESVIKALVIALLGLTVAAINHATALLRARVAAQQYKVVETLLDTIVRGIAQEFTEASNQTKFNAAIVRAKATLDAKGIKIDDALLSTWVESAYHKFKQDSLFSNSNLLAIKTDAA